MLKDLWSRLKLWCKNSDPFEIECDRLAELHKQNKAREKEWVETCLKQERKELRDEFAKAALTGLLSNPELSACDTYEAISDSAEVAYRIADAMLVEREKGKKEDV